MAEENPLENEDEIENQLDEQDEDFGLEEAEGDNITSEPENESVESDSQGKFTSLINALKTNRRYQFIAGGVLLLILIIASFSMFSTKEKPKDASPGMTQAEAPNFSSEEIVNKKSTKKKKKKIKYVDLYKQLESKQINPILRELSYKSISYNVVQNGKQFDLQVDEDQLDDAKHLLAIKGLPSGTVKGYEIFDEASNLGVTEFDKRIRLIRALSGEMEKSIMEFDVVDYAYVEIVIPETKLFAVTQPPVTSSILIKRKNGASINDETVYAIIQLVSNSVENLLPENISVVDTEGRVLSTGVIDRMTKKIEAIQSKAKQMPTQVGNGQVIIPVIEDVVDWFQLKFNYETVLEKKALNQLNGVLPVGSYKTAVTIDLNSVSKTGAPDIKQIVTSVVVDEQFEEVELNDDTLNQIKQAVAGAIGFVEGRDQIHISKAAFLPKRTILDDSEPLEKKVLMPKDSFSDKFSRVARLWPIFGIGCLISTIFIVIFAFLQSTVTKLLSGLKALGSLFKRKPKPVENEVKTEELIEPDSEEPVIVELNESEVVNNLKANSNFAQVIQLKAMSTQELESVVEELKTMVKGN